MENARNADWIEQRAVVLRTIDIHAEELEKLRDAVCKMHSDLTDNIVESHRDVSLQLAELRVSMAQLQTTARLWGALCGLAGGLACSIIAGVMLRLLMR